MILVCHEAILFSGRSQTDLKDDLAISIREGLTRGAKNEPRPRYIVVLTHWQDGRWRSGKTFAAAGAALAEETGSTVVMTMRAPKENLQTAAERFAVLGPNADRVATLLVEDTYYD